MKFALLATVLSATSAINVVSHQTINRELCFPSVSTSQSLVQTEAAKGWKWNMPGFYAQDKVVKELAGDQALDVLYKKAITKPVLVEVYHPQCPHCKSMVPKYHEAVKFAKDQKYNVETFALNISTLPEASFETVTNPSGPAEGGVPDIRLYTATGKYVSYQEDEMSAKGLEAFFQKNKVTK